MIRSTITLVILATVALLGSYATPLSQDLGWNELVYGEGIFHDEINSINTRSGEKHVILSELEDLLGQDGVLKTIYKKYLVTFEKDAPANPQESVMHFKDALFRVATHNLEHKNGEHTWERGINQFSDLSEDEFFEKHTMNPEKMAVLKAKLPPAENPPYRPVGPLGSSNFSDPPASVNWNDTGKVTSVKDQRQCNSCTQFATTAQLETVWSYFKSRSPVDLSPQESQDCSDPGTDHCAKGAWPEDAYNMFINMGSTTWQEYPYEGRYGQCRSSGKSHDARATKWYKPWDSTEEDIKKGVAGWGPLYVCINVSKELQDYRRNGIFNGNCDASKGLHSVVAIGYGSENGQDYWLIKNSWNTWWGENGYLKLARGRNACNIRQHPRILMVT